jgi:hypothetical protein
MEDGKGKMEDRRWRSEEKRTNHSSLMKKD